MTAVDNMEHHDGSGTQSRLAKGRTNRITAAAKNELYEFFAKSVTGWTSKGLPRERVDPGLDKLLTKLGLQRSQASRQLMAFKKARGMMPLSFNASADEINASLTSRVGGVEAVVSEVLDTFVETSYCTVEAQHPARTAEPASCLFRACRDAAQPHVQSLLTKFIFAIATCSAKSWGAVDSMMLQLTCRRSQIRDEAKEHFATDDRILAETRRYYVAGYPGAELLFCSLEMHAYQVLTEALADHERPFLSAADPLPPTDPKDPRAGLLYYLAGWLCYKVKRFVNAAPQQPFWSAWLASTTLTLERAQQSSLPWQLTAALAAKRSARYRKSQLVEYASRELFDFAWAVEATYVKLLTTTNFVAYGSDLVNSVRSAILKHEPTTCLFKKTIAASLHVQAAEGAVHNLMQYLLAAYHRMRGRDFVKSLMSTLRAAAAAQNRSAHRDRMAALSQPSTKKLKSSVLVNESSVPNEEDLAMAAVVEELSAREQVLQLHDSDVADAINSLPGKSARLSDAIIYEEEIIFAEEDEQNAKEEAIFAEDDEQNFEV